MEPPKMPVGRQRGVQTEDRDESNVAFMQVPMGKGNEIIIGATIIGPNVVAGD